VTVSTEPSIQDLTKGIQRRLETIDGLRAYAVEPDQANLPCAYPRLVDWTYHDTFTPASTTWHFDVWVIVGTEPRFGRAQTDMNEYLSPVGSRSIKCAIEGDAELNARVTGGGAYGRIDIAGQVALGASVRVEVLT